MRLHSGHRLKLFLREHSEWDAAKLANACGVAVPTVYAWQRDGIHSKSSGIVADTLGIDKEWLKSGIGEQPAIVDVDSVRATFLLSEMSKEEISKALGVSRPTLLKYENENCIPSEKQHRFEALRQHVEIAAEKNSIERERQLAAKSNNMKVTLDNDLMAPRLLKGDTVHIDTSDKNLTNSKIYAFDVSGTLIIRRVLVEINGTTLVTDDGSRSSIIDDSVRSKVVGRVYRFCGNLD